jgi:hypothetical protein
MIEELTAALKEYESKWNALVSERTDKAFFELQRYDAANEPAYY